jgi:hypothetical protein
MWEQLKWKLVKVSHIGYKQMCEAVYDIYREIM